MPRIPEGASQVVLSTFFGSNSGFSPTSVASALRAVRCGVTSSPPATMVGPLLDQGARVRIV